VHHVNKNNIVCVCVYIYIYILCLQCSIHLMFTFSERHVTVYHYNDTRSTVTRWSFDNDRCHVTAFRPISEAAHSWSYDKTYIMLIVTNLQSFSLFFMSHHRVYRSSMQFDNVLYDKFAYHHDNTMITLCFIIAARNKAYLVTGYVTLWPGM